MERLQTLFDGAMDLVVRLDVFDLFVKTVLDENLL